MPSTPERKRLYRLAHREETKERRPGERARRTARAKLRRNLLWRQQDGRCYLCGEEVEMAAAVLDHDHRCHREGYNCTVCRRGIACQRCNKVIGLARDEPALLRLIARNLELALADVDERLANKPVQAALQFTP